MSEVDVFVSYHRRSSGILARLISAELAANGVGVFLDVTGSPRTGPFPEHLRSEVARANLVVCVLAEDTLTSHWVNEELNYAFELGKPMIPVFQESFVRPSASDLTPAAEHLMECSGVQCFDLSNQYVEEAIRSLTQLIVVDPGAPPPSSWTGRGSADLEVYRQSLVAELNNNLVLELYDRQHYEDLCITPHVVVATSGATVEYPLDELLSRRRLAVIGEPGSGKTTALRKLCLDLIRPDTPRYVPVYVSLASFELARDQEVQDFSSFLDQEVRLLGAESIGALSASSGVEVLLALDGWDEMHDQSAIGAVRRYLSASRLPAIITSRPESQGTLPIVERASMAPLTESRVDEFLRLRLKSEETIGRLTKWLRSRSDLRLLAENPLNLSLLAIVFEEEGEDINRLQRTRLFERAFDAIVAQHHRLHSYESTRNDAGLTRFELETVLEVVAYDITRAGRRFFTAHELNRVGAQNTQTPHRDVAGIAAGTLGIIRDRRSGRLEFFHLWYQQFLAARHIIENSGGSTSDLVRELADAPMAGVLPFAVGLLGDPAVARRVLEEIPMQDLFNYCRALGEGDLNSSDLRALIGRAIHHGESLVPKVPVRVELAQALAQIGELAITPLSSIALDEKEGAYARRAAIEALALLPIDRLSFEALLLEALSTDQLGLLWHVIEQIGRIESVSAQAQLIDLLDHPDPIVVGDALWALGRIEGRNTERNPQDDEVRALMACLQVPDTHIQGHALRTLGRLRVESALPQLLEHLDSPAGAYRWIVPEAAALIGGPGALLVIERSLDDSDIRVVGAGLLACGSLDQSLPEPILAKVRGLLSSTDWVSSLQQPLGNVALQVLDATEHRSKRRQPVTVFLARHCQTRWSAEGRLQGSVDIPLSAEGVAHARELATVVPSLGVSRIYTSPYRRARETAEIYGNALAIPPTVLPGVRELDHGAWEGMLFSELDCDDAYRRWYLDPSSNSIPNSRESASVAQQRGVEALRSVVAACPGEVVLIVAHKHLLALLTCALRGVPLTEFPHLVRDDFTPIEIPSGQLERLFGALSSDGDPDPAHAGRKVP